LNCQELDQELLDPPVIYVSDPAAIAPGFSANSASISMPAIKIFMPADRQSQHSVISAIASSTATPTPTLVVPVASEVQQPDKNGPSSTQDI
jgi:hypothetical protein